MSRAIFDAPTIFPRESRIRGDCQRDVEKAAVLALPDRLEVMNPLASVDLVEDCRLFIAPVEGNDDRNRLADGLLRGEAEQPLRAVVPAENDAVEILRQDGVIRGFDNGLVVLGHAIVTAAPGTACGRLSRPRLMVRRMNPAFQITPR